MSHGKGALPEKERERVPLKPGQLRAAFRWCMINTALSLAALLAAMALAPRMPRKVYAPPVLPPPSLTIKSEPAYILPVYKRRYRTPLNPWDMPEVTSEREND